MRNSSVFSNDQSIYFIFTESTSFLIKDSFFFNLKSFTILSQNSFVVLKNSTFMSLDLELTFINTNIYLFFLNFYKTINIKNSFTLNNCPYAIINSVFFLDLEGNNLFGGITTKELIISNLSLYNIHLNYAFSKSSNLQNLYLNSSNFFNISLNNAFLSTTKPINLIISFCKFQ